MDNLENVYLNLSEKLKEIRKTYNLKQNEISKAIGISTIQICKYEKNRNELSIDKLLKLAKCYEVPIEHFIRPLSIEYMYLKSLLKGKPILIIYTVNNKLIVLEGRFAFYEKDSVIYNVLVLSSELSDEFKIVNPFILKHYKESYEPIYDVSILDGYRLVVEIFKELNMTSLLNDSTCWPTKGKNMVAFDTGIQIYKLDISDFVDGCKITAIEDQEFAKNIRRWFEKNNENRKMQTQEIVKQICLKEE